MDRMEFRVSQMSESDLRRIKSRAERASNGPLRLRAGWAPTIWLVIFVVAIGVLSLLSDSGTVRVKVLDVPIRASHILILVDGTSSMDDDGKPEKLRQQQTALEAAIADHEEDAITAFGISAQGRPGNLLHQLENHLETRSRVDAVYVISDFQPEDKDADCDDGAGIGRFRQLIRQNGLRLYLSSVQTQPSADLQAIAEESGGGVIGQHLQSSSDALREICGSFQ